MKAKGWRLKRLKELQRQGFDKSRAAGNDAIHVACSQCEALVINGVATHETGCPNARPHSEEDE